MEYRHLILYRECKANQICNTFNTNQKAPLNLTLNALEIFAEINNELIHNTQIQVWVEVNSNIEYGILFNNIINSFEL